ncbi:MAG: type secretion system ATPase, FliI/YscN [Phycisphaerales bacterium]|nr:type secretion system ATPase, FliI/YscN [Phycisphaerales bacterium]
MSMLAAQLEAVEAAMPYGVAGQVAAISGLTIEATHLPLPVGSLCQILAGGVMRHAILAEVIGFQGERTLLMSLSNVSGVSRGDRIELVTASPRVWCSDAMLGRVINGLGEPTDGQGPIPRGESRRIDAKPVTPMERVNIREPITTSIRAIDALHTCGQGQRMGIFSGPGVGKSTLMSQIAKHTDADISVIALIGERGREVQEFIENSMGPGGMARCVIVVCTSDETPLLKVRTAKVACAISEYFRDQGKNVLLLMDSLTRLAQAQRQIGLAAREPPATKGFPPSVFAMLPEIMERAGKTKVGSITGFYTVLVEGDDFNEPIPDAVKGISDGHLWLNRKLAAKGHFPAIDVTQSISRVRGDVSDPARVKQARRVLGLLATYDEIADLVSIGAYVAGINAEQDAAVMARPRIIDFLKQESTQPLTLAEAGKQLDQLCSWIDQIEKALAAKAAAAAGTKPASKPGPR